MKRRFEARKRKKEALSIEAAELAARTMKDLHFPMDTFAEPAPFPWDDVPTDLNPSAGALLDGRAMRKRHQLESLMRFVLPFLLPGDRCVDFGCGTGHYGLMVAYLRPDVSVVLVEREDGRAKMGRERMEALDLANCAFFHGSLEDYLEAQVLCPCCYGQVGGKEGRTALPQSQALKNLGLTCEDFVKITSCADMDVVSQNGFDFEEDPKFYRAKVCMQTVDLDRLLRCMSYSESLPSISLNNAR
eukprot:GEMP01063235.1.p1 GENE.GEMP01063235.1~~GEMP01063235.1.p1  ORF type:complete len:245 (+),score=51.02 GEMP01063235.1:76-810(+)